MFAIVALLFDAKHWLHSLHPVGDTMVTAIISKIFYYINAYLLGSKPQDPDTNKDDRKNHQGFQNFTSMNLDYWECYVKNNFRVL